MDCLHPFERTYKDALTGEIKKALCPCGKCINCLHVYQDMWAIRLSETAKWYGNMVYDTYTINPDHMTCIIDLTKPTKEGNLYGTTVRFRLWKVEAFKKSYRAFHRYFPAWSYDTYKILRKTGFKVYDFPKIEVQNFIKRGREALFRDKGKRVEFSYFLVKEFGPSTSRPHFHILMFGLSFADYMTYFGNSAKRFGFTRPVYKEFRADQQKDFSCIVRYLSKYCSKGVFESPLVKDRLQKRPYKLISKGLGAGYLYRDFFNVFKKPELSVWSHVHCPSEKVYQSCCERLVKLGKLEALAKYKEYYSRCRADVNFALSHKLQRESGFNSEAKYIDLSFLLPSDIDKLCIYYDSGGFPHKLPVYYRNKLLSSKSNEQSIYKFEVQNVLQSRARLLDNQGKARVAARMGLRIPAEILDKDSTDWGLSACDLFMVDYQYLIEQKSEAQAKAERRYSRLKNFYNRGKMNLTNPACH